MSWDNNVASLPLSFYIPRVKKIKKGAPLHPYKNNSNNNTTIVNTPFVKRKRGDIIKNWDEERGYRTTSYVPKQEQVPVDYNVDWWDEYRGYIPQRNLIPWTYPIVEEQYWSKDSLDNRVIKKKKPFIEDDTIKKKVKKAPKNFDAFGNRLNDIVFNGFTNKQNVNDSRIYKNFDALKFIIPTRPSEQRFEESYIQDRTMIIKCYLKSMSFF